jgi:hypothetical protein
VYEVNAYDYKRNRAYRLINPDFKVAHETEAAERDVNTSQAWDDVEYVHLDTDDDFIRKALSIIAGEEYDTRVDVPLTLPDESLFQLMKMAHEQDITLNQLVEDILRNVIALHETGTDDPIDFPMRDEYDFSEGVRGPVAKMKAKKKKGKK